MDAVPESRDSRPDDASADDTQSPAESSRGGGNARLIVIALVLLLLIAAVGVVVVLQVAGDREPQTAAEVELAEIETLLSQNATDVVLYMRKAEVFHSIGQDEEALETLQVAEDLDPDGPLGATLYAGMAKLTYALGDVEGALGYVERGLELADLADLYFLKGEWLDETGDVDGAEEAWLAGIESEPNAAGIRRVLARFYEEQGRDSEALAQWQEAARFLPNDPEVNAAIERLGGSAGDR